MAKTKPKTKSKAKTRARAKTRPKAKVSAKARTSAKKISSLEVVTPLALLFADLEDELATTRRVLARVPDGREDWRPHTKSKTLGDLASHVAQLPGFGILMLTADEYDGSKGRPDSKPASTAERLRIYEALCGQLRPHFQRLTWERARAPWTLRFGDRVFARAPRANVLRTALLSHIAHHRSQLGVYLRLLDVPVPYTYGPSADEMPPSTSL